MKKTLLALAVLAAAGSVNAAEIVKNDSGSVNFYGQIREAMTYSHSNAESKTAADAGSSRAGINASWKLTDDLNLIGKAEFGIVSSMKGRQNWIGISSDDYGSLYVGRTALLADDVYGAEYSWYYGIADKALYDTDLANDYYWQDNAINYDFIKDNYFVRAQYNLAEKDSAAKQASIFVGSSMGDLSFHSGIVYFEDNTAKTAEKVIAAGDTDASGTAYDSDDYGTVGTVKTGGNDVESLSSELTVEYKLDALTVGATYAHIDRTVNNSHNDSNGYNLGVMYKLSDATTAYGGYQYVEMQDKSNADIQNSYVGVSYRPVTWALTYVEYGYNDTESKDAVNALAVGARVYW